MFQVHRTSVWITLFSILLLSSMTLVWAAEEINAYPLRIIWSMEPKPDRQPTLDWLQQKNWCWALEVSHDASEQTIRDIREMGYEVILDMHAHPEILKRHLTYHKRDMPNQDEVLQRSIRAAGGDPSKVIWQMILENDSAGVAHPQDLIRTRVNSYAQAQALFEKHLDQAMAFASNYPKVQKWGVCGYVTALHDVASRGLDCISIERTNDDVEDIQTGIAFCRGAARQYNCDWGVDLSLWWGPFYGCIPDIPTAYHKRNLYLAYFSGARTMRIEGGDLFYDPEEKRMRLLADTIDKFGKFTRRFDPGMPDVPVAIVLPADHGWMTPPYWRTTNEAWNYARLPYRPGDRGIDGIFGSAFPGSNFTMQPFPFGPYEVDVPPASPFALSCVTPEFAPEPRDVYKAEPPIPFGKYQDRNQARHDIHLKQIETSPYRPMGTSRWGDIFDVFTDSVELEVLSNYPVVILAGPVKITPNLRQTILSFVRQGGTLVVAAGVVGPADCDLTGVQIQPELIPANAWTWKNAPPVAEPLMHVPATLKQGDKTEILALSSEATPLVTVHSIGKGKVYTCLAPWFEGSNRALAKVALQMLDKIIEPIQPGHIQGLPTEWVTTRSDHGRSIIVANHSSQSWNGKVILHNVPKKYSICSDPLTRKTVSFTRNDPDVSADITIDPWDIRILHWKE